MTASAPTSSSERSSIAEVLRFAAPVSLAMVLHQLFGVVDQAFVASLGDQALVAVGVVNQILGVASITFVALGAGGAIPLARYAGAQDAAAFSATAALLVVLGALGSVAAALILAALAPLILSAMGLPPAVVALGVPFLRLIVFSLPLLTLAEVGHQVLRARGDSYNPMLYTLASLVVNTVLGWLLIFGWHGLPKLGLAGAAAATVLARGVGCILVYRKLFSGEHTLRLHVAELLRPDWKRARGLYALTLPVATDQALWTLGLVAYTIVFTHLGTTKLAAINVCQQLEALWLMFSIGFSAAGVTQIGQELGRKNMDGAHARAQLLLRMAGAASLATGLLTAAVLPLLPILYPKLSAETLSLTAGGLLLAAALQPVKTWNMVLASGVLRTGGDVRFVLRCQLFIGLGVAASYLLGFPLRLGFYGAMIGKALEELGKLIAFVWRYRSMRWMHGL